MPDTEPTGPLVLVVNPDPDIGAFLIRLPGGNMMLRACQSAVGGYVEAIGPFGGEWVCYATEDGTRLGLTRNRPASELITELGFVFGPGDSLRGTVMFLGSGGTRETDVPERVITLARDVLGDVMLQQARGDAS